MISKNDVRDVQKEWADAVVLLGKLREDPHACRQAANKLIPSLYAVKEKEILFKPTLAARFQFRRTEEEVISARAMVRTA